MRGTLLRATYYTALLEENPPDWLARLIDWLAYNGYHPAAFFCALLNQQPMGFWSPAVLVGDAKRHGVTLLAVDVQRSNHVCTLDGGALRIGLHYVSGLGAQGAERIEAARQAGPFTDLADFCQRTRLPKRLVERLILGGACDGWGERRKLLWRLGTLTYRADELPIPDPSAEAISLPPLSDFESHLWERETLGLATGEHLLTHYRAALDGAGILGSATLERVPSGRTVRVAGLKVMHQAPPTAKGVHFLTLEDEDGLLNIVVRPEVYKRYRVIVRQHSLLIIAGTVQRRGAVCNVVATHLQGIHSARRDGSGRAR